MTTHSYPPEEKRSFTEYINEQLNDDSDLQFDMPMNPESESLFTTVSKGLLLCKLVEKIKPGTIKEKICTKQNPNPYERLENHTIVLEACKTLNLIIVNIGPKDLDDGIPHLILGVVWQLLRFELLSQINLHQYPELSKLIHESEGVDQFVELTPEENLFRWINFHLKRAGSVRHVSNFSEDLKDSECLIILLSSVAPDVCTTDGLLERDLESRAEIMLQNADKLGCRKFATPRDIVAGNSKLLLAFVANLFHRHPRIEATTSEEKLKQLWDAFQAKTEHHWTFQKTDQETTDRQVQLQEDKLRLIEEEDQDEESFRKSELERTDRDVLLKEDELRMSEKEESGKRPLQTTTDRFVRLEEQELRLKEWEKMLRELEENLRRTQDRLEEEQRRKERELAERVARVEQEEERLKELERQQRLLEQETVNKLTRLMADEESLKQQQTLLLQREQRLVQLEQSLKVSESLHNDTQYNHCNLNQIHNNNLGAPLMVQGLSRSQEIPVSLLRQSRLGVADQSSKRRSVSPSRFGPPPFHHSFPTVFGGTRFYQHLSHHDERRYIIVVDRSYSMDRGNTWTDTQLALARLASFACRADPNGITLYLFSELMSQHPRYDNIKDPKQVEEIFNQEVPFGSTDLTGVLRQAFTDHFQQTKPTSILIITDGCPDEKKSARKEIVQAANRVRNETELSLTFVQIGDDRKAIKFFKMLDTKLQTRFKIVDRVTSDQMIGMTLDQLLQQTNL
eukprot:TRINITY_DN1589_c0_g1_i1.p1 TRINITY_DN1589_c0_g1~~TRINITY_DN1589_c0_g1_i1.p1  ORF type:complete len:738 (+),score=149.03 TRINITY_DN1589_c0_g1_i1:49-2262(+)